MLYESAYALGICFLLIIGFLILAFSLSMTGRAVRAMAMILSGLMIITSLYFSYRWNIEKGDLGSGSENLKRLAMDSKSPGSRIGTKPIERRRNLGPGH
jgi:hypothetical protein